MNEILSKTREIEENSFFIKGTTIGCSGNVWKSPMKMCKKAISGIFPAFSVGKKFFLKITLGHALAIAITHFWTKKSIKTNDEISRKCQKTGFSGIFPAFSAGKKCFSKIGLRHVLGNANLHQCAKFHEKFKVQLEKFKKYHFSGENRHFRAIFRKFRLQKSV